MTAAGRLRPSSLRFLTWGTMSNGLCPTANILESPVKAKGVLICYLDPRCAGKILPVFGNGAKLLYNSSAGRKDTGSMTQKE